MREKRIDVRRSPLGTGISVSLISHVLAALVLSLITLTPLRVETVPIEVEVWRGPAGSGGAEARPEQAEPKVEAALDLARKGEAPGKVIRKEPPPKGVRAETSVKEPRPEDILVQKQQVIDEEMKRREKWESRSQEEPGLLQGYEAGVGTGGPRGEEGAGTGKALGVRGPVGERSILSSPLPAYPEWAKRQGVEGEVLLKFWVSSDGLVSKVEILQFSGFRDFDERAARALQAWRFEPLGPEEEQVEQWGTVPFKFRLEKRVR